MGDDIELPSGDYVPIQDTVCACEHAYAEHAHGAARQEPSCPCLCFVASWNDVPCGPEAAADAHAAASAVTMSEQCRHSLVTTRSVRSIHGGTVHCVL